MRQGVLVLSLLAAGISVGAFSAGLDTQAPTTPPAGTGLIVGQIVDASSGKGVSGAIVTLGNSIPAASHIGELVEANTTPVPTGRRILTSSDGRFLFRDLPKGRYALTSTAPGFAPSTYGQGRPVGPGQTIDLADGEKLGGVTLRAWKLASISGSIVDERGEPAVNVTVRCLKRVIAGGQPRYTQNGVAAATTDDRGMYRIGSLVPAEYICGVTATTSTSPVAALDLSDAGAQNSTPAAADAYRRMQASGGRGDGSGFHLGDLIVRITPPPASPSGRFMTYLTQYFPAALTTKEASVIALKSGEERAGVDLQLRLVSAVRLSGQVDGPAGPVPFMNLVLYPASVSDIVSDGLAESARAISDATGMFTFAGVPAGQYTLRVRMFPQPVAPARGGGTPIVEGAPVAPIDMTSLAPGGGTMGRGGPPPPPPPNEPSLWATVPITVGDTDMTGIAVTLRDGIRVSGRVEFVGSRPQPSADAVQRMSIRMESAEGRTSSPIVALGRAAADMSFRTGGYAGGRYIAAAINTTIPAGWALKSVTHNGRDISVDPVELADSDIGGVVMTFTDQTTELSGAVTTAAGAPDANCDLVVFPADSQAWKEVGVVARRWRDERATKTGTFTMAGLPPGEYFVAAVPTDAAGEHRDPKFLQTLIPGATRVALADGEKKSITVKRR